MMIEWHSWKEIFEEILGDSCVFCNAFQTQMESCFTLNIVNERNREDFSTLLSCIAEKRHELVASSDPVHYCFDLRQDVEADRLSNIRRERDRKHDGIGGDRGQRAEHLKHFNMSPVDKRERSLDHELVLMCHKVNLEQLLVDIFKS